jgi:release factor glutamine methyltransferase
MTIYELIASPSYPQKSVVKQLICAITDMTIEQVLMQMDMTITESDYQKFETMYHQYAIDHKPLEYIIGYVVFFGHRFSVTQDTLIPRAETEYMVVAVTDYCQTLDLSHAYSLRDIGTGCGVLGCSVLLRLPDHFGQVVMTDISQSALNIARSNHNILIWPSSNYDLQMIQSSLLDFVWWSDYSDQFIILVANLPYIPDETFDTQVSDTVRLREPRMAFVWGDDGLAWYYQMLDQIVHYRWSWQLNSIVCFCEMMTRQLDILQQKYVDRFNFVIHKTFHFNIIIVEINIAHKK